MLERPTSPSPPSRVQFGEFAFPLGVYPEQPYAQETGYTIEYEVNEELGDRYLVQIVASFEFVGHLLIHLFRILPEQVLPLLEILTLDQRHERDLLTGDTPVNKEELLEFFRDHQAVILDDGFVGFGAMSKEPDTEVFLTEHKVFNVYTRNLEFIEYFLEGLGIPLHTSLSIFCYETPHLHIPLIHYPAFSAQHFSFRHVRDLLIDRFALQYDFEMDEETEDTGEQRVWIADCAIADTTALEEDVTRRFIGIKAANRVDAMRMLQAQALPTAAWLQTLYEMYETSIDQLEPGAAAAARIAVDGIFYTWHPLAARPRIK
ncbi:hypothetical protein JW905_09530 [bacterium]|nr:hypothetical protein [candidate division CSSED10-310 bacterium]